MTQMKVTPAFLIKLMQNSRGLTNTQLMDVFDSLRKETDLLTGEDVERIFLSSEDTIVPNSETNVWAEGKEVYARKVNLLLTKFLSSIDQNLTDEEVYNLYAYLIQLAIDKKEMNEAASLAFLNQYVEENHDDIASLSNDEINNIIRNQEQDEFGSIPLATNWPGQEMKDVFNKKLDTSKTSNERIPIR